MALKLKKPRLIGPTVWEAEEITGFSNIMPFSYPRLIVLEAEEIAWRSNKLGIVSQ